MVSGGNSSPHKLSGAPGNVPGSQNFCEGSEQLHYPVQVRQCHSSNLCESEGGDPLRCAVQAGSGDLGMVSRARDNSDSRTSPRVRQCNSRPRIEISSRSVRLDVEPFGIPSYAASAGSSGARPVCISTHNSITPVLQLASRPGGGSNRHLHAELGPQQRLCKPTVVFNKPLPATGVSTAGKNCNDSSLVEHSTLVSSDSGNAAGLPTTPPQQARSGDSSNRAGIHNVSRSACTNRMAHLRDSFTSQGLSGEASELLLASWRDKTNKSYNSLCTKWFSWCQPRNRNPFDGPMADVVNFLAELHAQGYQYRSLNSYRSAISSIHNNVDGHPIGQHPLVPGH